jgi:beta-lactamase regulating signal transducer with metallopeptidase domain
MNAHLPLAGQLNWLLNHSLQAGALVLLVLAVQWIFRRKLTNRWRFALWWIVLARLLLPFNPPSAVSVFNFLRPAVHVEQLRQPAPAVVAAPATHFPDGNFTPAQPAQNVLPPTEIAQRIQPNVAENPSMPAPPPSSAPTARKQPVAPHDFLIPGLAGLWLAGILVLLGAVMAQLLRFRRKLATATTLNSGLQQLLDDCRRDFGISRRVQVLETDAVQSPALFGVIRLRLLVPRGFEAQFAGRELRYIFLHELAHVKRGDLWLNWLVTALQIMHWFNPLLWLGFARLRADRELACDELALLRAGDSAGTAYGETVVKLLENLSRPAAIPGLVGILEDKKQMRRRISMIANFRRPGRWSALAFILVAAVAAAALTDAQTEKPVKGDAAIIFTNHPFANGTDGNILVGSNLVAISNLPSNTKFAVLPRLDLTGTVTAKDGGLLPVTATVFIETAGPKTGTSTFCPSCYPDCVKHMPTDAQGNFRIESLDSQLTFQVLAVAKGYQPKTVSKVDPAKGPMKIGLAPLADADAAPDRSLRGRVVNSEGHPIQGAVVDMVGIETKSGGGRYGALEGIDPLAVTDENGEFLITSQKPFDLMDVKVSARTFADKSFRQLPSGKPNTLAVTEGATIRGRVVSGGHPVKGVSVGISGVERESSVYVGHFEIGTDADGKFTFVNVPPDVDFWIYTGMSSMKGFGAVPMRKIHSAKDDETNNVGDLVAAPAHTLAGRVVLADGQPLPPKVRLLVSRDEAWDSMQITLDADGNFAATDVPNELVDLSARVKGYRVSARNLSLDQMNPFRLIGRVDRDITNLVFMLEKGPDPRPDYQNIDPEYNEIRNRTLRGAEGVEEHSRDWTVSGRVIDAETKQPVQNFRVTPGQIGQMDRAAWNTLRAVDGSNGVYSVFINKRVSRPMMKAEADGYLPAEMEIFQGDATNADFALKKGIGPVGTVVTPDGKPVADATVVILNGEWNQANVNGSGQLTTIGDRPGSGKSDANGHFLLKPVLNMKSLAVGSSNGLVIVSLTSLASNSTVTLEPFGKIHGTLKRTSGPGTNETLDATFAGDARGLNMWLPAQTDEEGRFSFEHVPAGHLQISYRVPMMNGRSWHDNPLQKVDLQPGQNLEVNITAPDRVAENPAISAPPPMPKQIGNERLEGVVLRPDGKPAADAEVALQLESGPFNLQLGRGTLVSSGLREMGLHVNADASGKFDLPLYEKAIAVVAVSEAGFAQVSLDEFKKSPQIQLQKFGRIEGTLRVGHHPGTNETVGLSAAMPRWSKKAIRQIGSTNGAIEFTNPAPAIVQPLMFDWQAFSARTDENGKFTLPFVPPGERSLWRKIPGNENSWTQSQLGTVDVQPGQTLVTNVGGSGRTVTGKVQFAGALPVDFKNGMGVITTPTFKLYEKMFGLKTDAERKTFLESPEAEAMQKEYRSFSVRIAADGSFKAEDVLPGDYELVFQPQTQLDPKSRSWTMLASAQEFTVPPAKNDTDDSVVELGTIGLKKRELPMPETAPEKK